MFENAYASKKKTHHSIVFTSLSRSACILAYSPLLLIVIKNLIQQFYPLIIYYSEIKSRHNHYYHPSLHRRANTCWHLNNYMHTHIHTYIHIFIFISFICTLSPNPKKRRIKAIKQFIFDFDWQRHTTHDT